MKRIKYLLLVLVLLITPLMLTGCGANKNESPKTVSEAMMQMLVKDDYRGAKDIFYHEDSYFTDEAFASVVKARKLSLKGNKNYKVASVGKEIKDVDGNTTVTVTYSLDNNKTFTFNTIKVDEKWYVYDKSFYDGDIYLAVPKGATVKFDNQKLKDPENSKSTISVKHPKMDFSTIISDVDVDVYEVPNVLSGKYDVVIKGSNGEVKEKVGTYTNYKKSEKYVYSYRTGYKDKKFNVTYTFNVPGKNNKAETFVNNFYKDVYNSANNKKEFKEVNEKYFDSNSKKLNNMKSTYNNLLSRIKDGRYSSYSGFFKTTKLYDYGNHVVLVGTLEIKYKTKSYSSNNLTDRKVTKNTVLVLRKTKNGYALTDGQYYLPCY